jgi:hypothetical protein
MYFENRVFAKLLPVLLIGLLACDPKTDEQPSPGGSDKEQPASGTPTPMGEPVGTPTTGIIGPAGGRLTTADGTLTLNFPAGALKQPTPITIQPITNTAYLGAGLAYRFSPDGAQFVRPVTLTWHYQSEAIDGSAPEALGIAFQDKQGTWQASAKVQLDKKAQTVSAELAHFSDWSFYMQFFMRSNQHLDRDEKLITLAPGEHVQLTTYYLERAPTRPDTNLLVPLNLPKVLAERVVRWTINGVTADAAYDDYSNNGQLRTDNTYAQAVYDAPPREPDTNPISLAVELDLKQHGHLVLVRNVRIESPASLRIDGSVDNNPLIGLTLQGSQLLGTIANQQGRQVLMFTIQQFKGNGTYSINEQHTVLITARVPDRIPYVDSYIDLSGKWVSGGASIRITDYQGADKPIRGQITGNLFWLKPSGNSVVIENMPISAKFKALAVGSP